MKNNKLLEDYLLIEQKIHPIKNYLEKHKDDKRFKGLYKGIITMQSPGQSRLKKICKNNKKQLTKYFYIKIISCILVSVFGKIRLVKKNDKIKKSPGTTITICGIF